MTAIDGAVADPRTRVGGRTPTDPVAPATPDHLTRSARLMGGTVGIHIGLTTRSGPAEQERARRDGDRLLGRIAAWAAHLTRFDERSDLSHLNADPRDRVPVRPTLAALLDWGRQAEALTDGIVDIALLDARIAAEQGAPAPIARRDASAASRGWAVDRRPRGSVVRRPPGLRFDLDGVAKGWLADRAIEWLARYPSACVDADGDLAIRLGPGQRWRFAVTDPGVATAPLLELELGAPGAANRSFGLATSGTSIHRWSHGGSPAHHLVDPRTGRPAATDVVQATVLAGSARAAELFAKAAVIVGSRAALAALDRPDVAGAVLLTVDGDVLLTPATMAFVA